MQATLLTAAIALILALVAALVGPLLIDWGTYRPLFEAEASRLIGLDVAVKGKIDARLLPSPQITLHDIEIKGVGADVVKARALDVEFALGPLMRGEWRATDLRLSGPQLRLGLDAAGHVTAPAVAIGFRSDALSIERLSIQDGRVTLTDAASNSSVTLDQVYFNGEAGSLLGPLRGEGDVVVGGAHYPYRVAAGRYGNDGTLKLKINVDPRDQPLNFEANGTLVFDGAAPKFDGAWDLTRPAGIRASGGAVVSQPWHLRGKVKVTAASALMENLEFLSGSEEHGLKLTGIANFKFGKAPRFEGVLSGHQIDLDGVLGDDSGRASPGAALRKLADWVRGAFRPAIPIQIGIGIDQLTLAGSPLQNLRGDISADASGWDLKSFEFRAPGFTQARLSGHLAVGDDGVTFSGPAEIDSSDPSALAAWLQGRDPPSRSNPRALRLRGDLTFGSEKIAVERLTAEFARRTMTGKFAYAFAAGGHPSKLDAVLNAPELDLDTALGFGKALFAGSGLERPHDMTIAADIGRVTITGIEGRNISARMTVDAERWEIERLAIADLGGASFFANGRLVLSASAPRGDMRFDLNAPDMVPVMALLARLAPNVAQALERRASAMAPAKLHAQLTVGAPSAASEAKFAINGTIGKVRLALNAGSAFDMKRFDPGTLRFNGTLAAEDGKALIAMLGLDSVVAVGAGPAALTLDAIGPARGEWHVDGKLTAGGLNAAAAGAVNIFAATPTAAFHATIAKADIAPLRGPGPALPASLAARIALSDKDLSLSDIDAAVAGAKLRGRLTVGLAKPHRLQGEIDADTVDGPALLALAIGMPAGAVSKGMVWEWPDAPFDGGVFGDYSGTVAIKARHFDILPRFSAREFRATLRFGKNEFTLDDVAGAVSGGKLAGTLVLSAGDKGVAARGKIALAGADIAPLLPAAARPPVGGALDVSLALAGEGLSPVALIGSLNGSGKIALANAAFAGLDPRAFDAVTRAIDQGLTVDASRIADVVRKALDSGQLTVKRAQGTIAVNAGQVRVNDFAAAGADADLSLLGNLDLIDGTLDAHLVLSGKSSGARPDIFMSVKGPLAAPARSVDVSALTGWLTLRAVENEAKRLKALERAPPKSGLNVAPASAPVVTRNAPPIALAPPAIAMPPQAAPALPAPIYVNPLPTPRGPKPEASIGAQH